MKLQKAPILHLFKLEVDPKNHDKLIQSMLDAHLDQNALFLATSSSYKILMLQSLTV